MERVTSTGLREWKKACVLQIQNLSLESKERTSLVLSQESQGMWQGHCGYCEELGKEKIKEHLQNLLKGQDPGNV